MVYMGVTLAHYHIASPNLIQASDIFQWMPISSTDWVLNSFRQTCSYVLEQ